MSPLKPHTLATHPRKPQPRESRAVNCPKCDQAVQVSKRAVSLRCPRCGAPFKLEDVQIDQAHNRDVDTMGHVHLGRHSNLRGNLACGELTVDGRYEGDAEVHGKIELHSGAQVLGSLAAQSLTIEPGANFRGQVRIGPARPSQVTTL